jgi:hypothetical protein
MQPDVATVFASAVELLGRGRCAPLTTLRGLNSYARDSEGRLIEFPFEGAHTYEPRAAMIRALINYGVRQEEQSRYYRRFMEAWLEHLPGGSLSMWYDYPGRSHEEVMGVAEGALEWLKRNP